MNGKVFSTLQQTCLDVANLNIKLNPLKDGTKTSGSLAFIIFDETNSNAELFLPNLNNSTLLKKTNEGNWSSDEYKLIAWKGYVLQYKGKPIFGGE